MALIDGDFTIVIADDDPDDRFLAESAFKELGIPGSLIMAKSGEELLHYLDKCISCEDQEYIPPEFILLDLNMPEKSGWDILEEIKEIRTLQDIPIVIWTGSESDEDRLLSIELGADYFVTKPSEYSDLLSCIHSLIRIFCGSRENTKVKIPVTINNKKQRSGLEDA